MIEWGNRPFVWVAIAVTVVLALAYALDYTRRRRLLERLGHAPQLRRMAESVSPVRRGIKAFCTIGGVALLTLSIARPQVEGQQDWRQRGIDLALVIDFSKSMLVGDVDPENRIQRVKHEVDDLIDHFSGDRVAIVAFAGAAIHYPLTSDYEPAKILYNGLHPADLPPGSDIGEAILTARCILRPGIKNDKDCERLGGNGHGGDPTTEEEARYMAQLRGEVKQTEDDRARAIVLFTDGEDTEGHAAQEVENAKKLGIQVFVVGVGTKDGGQIPEFDDDGNPKGFKVDGKGQPIIAKLDEKGLKELASAGGGEDHYYRLHPRRLGTGTLVTALRQLKAGERAWRPIKKPRDVFEFFLFPGFMLLLIEACLSDRRRLKARAAAKEEVRA